METIGIIAFTKAGCALAKKLADGLGLGSGSVCGPARFADELGIDLSQFQSYIPNDKGTFTGSAEEDGFTVESYSVPLDVELGEGVSMTEAPKDTVVKYYYDANGDIKKIVTDTGIMGESTMEITSLTVGGVTIELPDTTGLKLVTKEEMEAAEQAESNESAEESQN